MLTLGLAIFATTIVESEDDNDHVVNGARVWFLLIRNMEQENGSVSPCRFHPDAPSVLVDDSLADSQTDPASRISVARMETFEQFKYLSVIFRRDSNSVVGDGEGPARILSDGRNVNTRRLGTSILQRITDQVL